MHPLTSVLYQLARNGILSINLFRETNPAHTQARFVHEGLNLWLILRSLTRTYLVICEKCEQLLIILTDLFSTSFSTMRRERVL